MLNGLVGTPLEELFVVYNRISQILNEKGIKAYMPHIGEFLNSDCLGMTNDRFIKR